MPTDSRINGRLAISLIKENNDRLITQYGVYKALVVFFGPCTRRTLIIQVYLILMPIINIFLYVRHLILKRYIFGIGFTILLISFYWIINIVFFFDVCLNFFKFIF